MASRSARPRLLASIVAAIALVAACHILAPVFVGAPAVSAARTQTALSATKDDTRRGALLGFLGSAAAAANMKSAEAAGGYGEPPKISILGWASTRTARPPTATTLSTKTPNPLTASFLEETKKSASFKPTRTTQTPSSPQSSKNVGGATKRTSRESWTGGSPTGCGWRQLGRSASCGKTCFISLTFRQGTLPEPSSPRTFFLTSRDC